MMLDNIFMPFLIVLPQIYLNKFERILHADLDQERISHSGVLAHYV